MRLAAYLLLKVGLVNRPPVVQRLWEPLEGLGTTTFSPLVISLDAAPRDAIMYWFLFSTGVICGSSEPAILWRVYLPLVMRGQ